MFIPKKVTKGVILKVKDADGNKRYDFQYTDKYGYTNTIGGISRLFDEEFWNYAKLISGVLRNGMPILDVVTLIESLHLNTESINTWKNGVARALKQYIPDGTKAKEKCPNCGQETLVYQNNCPVCITAGSYEVRLILTPHPQKGLEPFHNTSIYVSPEGASVQLCPFRLRFWIRKTRGFVGILSPFKNAERDLMPQNGTGLTGGRQMVFNLGFDSVNG